MPEIDWKYKIFGFQKVKDTNMAISGMLDQLVILSTSGTDQKSFFLKIPTFVTDLNSMTRDKDKKQSEKKQVKTKVKILSRDMSAFPRMIFQYSYAYLNV